MKLLLTRGINVYEVKPKRNSKRESVYELTKYKIVISDYCRNVIIAEIMNLPLVVPNFKNIELEAELCFNFPSLPEHEHTEHFPQSIRVVPAR